MKNKKILSNKILNNSSLCILGMIISALFSFCYFTAINPFFYNTELDSACYYIIGSSIEKGFFPYIDFIDNKGPLTYFIYYLSSLLLGGFPNGIFIINSVLLFVSLSFIYRILKNKGLVKTSLCVIVFLLLYACLSYGGNTEDLSVPFILWSFWILVDFNEKEKPFCGLPLSVSFWLCAMTRLNNAVPIGVIVLCIGIKLILNKNVKEVFKYIGYLLTGSVVSILPFVYWLVKNNALIECLNQCFINNFKYSNTSMAFSKSQIFFYSYFGLVLFFFAAVSIGACIYYFKEKKNGFIAVSSISVVLITLASYYVVTQTYRHYLICLFVPAYFCSVILLFGLSENKADKFLKTLLIGVMCFALMFTKQAGMEIYLSAPIRVGSYIIHFKRYNEGSDIKKELVELGNEIPDGEKDSVFTIGRGALNSFLAFNDIIPCKRMFVCSDIFTDISDEYAEEFKGYFETDPPKWLITEKPINEIEICDISGKLEQMYTLEKSESLVDYNSLFIYHILEGEK